MGPRSDVKVRQQLWRSSDKTMNTKIMPLMVNLSILIYPLDFKVSGGNKGLFSVFQMQKYTWPLPFQAKKMEVGVINPHMIQVNKQTFRDNKKTPSCSLRLSFTSVNNPRAKEPKILVYLSKAISPSGCKTVYPTLCFRHTKLNSLLMSVGVERRSTFAPQFPRSSPSHVSGARKTAPIESVTHLPIRRG